MADKQITGLPTTSGVEETDDMLTNKSGIDYHATVQEVGDKVRERSIAVFDTVNDMTTQSLVAGQYVRTRGYVTKNDGREAEYLVKTSAEYSGTADETTDHTLANNNIAERLVKKDKLVSVASTDPVDASKANTVVFSSIGSSTINGISGGHRGQHLTLVNDSGGVITLNEDTDMRIEGSSYAIPDNGVIELVYTGSLWFEKSRSDNT